jgi:hypothetical protein
MLSMQHPTDQSKEVLMAIIVLANIVFAALVVGGILTLLSWGIAADRVSVATLARHPRAAIRGHRQPAPRFSPYTA